MASVACRLMSIEYVSIHRTQVSSASASECISKREQCSYEKNSKPHASYNHSPKPQRRINPKDPREGKYKKQSNLLQLHTHPYLTPDYSTQTPVLCFPCTQFLRI